MTTDAVPYRPLACYHNGTALLDNGGRVWTVTRDGGMVVRPADPPSNVESAGLRWLAETHGPLTVLYDAPIPAAPPGRDDTTAAGGASRVRALVDGWAADPPDSIDRARSLIYEALDTTLAAGWHDTIAARYHFGADPDRRQKVNALVREAWETAGDSWQMVAVFEALCRRDMDELRAQRGHNDASAK